MMSCSLRLNYRATSIVLMVSPSAYNYCKSLSSAMICMRLSLSAVAHAMDQLMDALDQRDENAVLTALRKPQLGLRHINDANVLFYIGKLLQAADLKRVSVDLVYSMLVDGLFHDFGYSDAEFGVGKQSAHER